MQNSDLHVDILLFQLVSMNYKVFRIVMLLLIGVIGSLKAEFPATTNSLVFNNSQEAFIRSRIEYLDRQTPIKLEYNSTINGFINHYIYRKPETLATVVGRQERYFPLFEESLSKYELPLELKYLPVIESALNPLAVSRSGAVGLWQFLYHTSRMFKMEISSYKDERRDPVISTDAACQYLKYLYQMFNDWQLAITAYNCGPGMIEKAIIQSGGKTDYWSIRSFLSKEAQGYYPTFVAATYSMNFYKEHDIIPLKDQFSFYEIGAVTLSQSVHFKQIADVIGVEVEVLKELNPMFLTGYIPVEDKKVELFIPKRFVRLFYQTEKIIYAYKVEHKNYLDLKAEVDTKVYAQKKIHHVNRGEFFHTIAMKYGCTIDEIMTWNGMSSRNLLAGQPLVVYEKSHNAYALYSRLKVIDPTFTTYIIKDGDTLQEIAEMFPMNDEAMIRSVNQLDDNNVSPGQAIKVIQF